jgi:hypothetical protein
LPQRSAYRDAWLTVRVPDGRKISSVRINGQPWSDFDAARSRIRLPKLAGRLEIQVITR